MSKRKNLSRVALSYAVVSLVLLVLVSLPNGISTSDITQTCLEECQSRMQQDISVESECDGPCSVQQCLDGCTLWKDSVNSSCPSICNKPASTHTQSTPCIVGCNIGIAAYLENLKRAISDKLTPPRMVNRTHDSVTITWSESPYANISFLVQWQYETGNSNWESYEPEALLKSNIVQIKGLHPYTSYKFRVAWILLPLSDPCLSEESPFISTLEHGAPSSEPVITSLAAVGSSSISVSWEPPLFTNGIILTYNLNLTDVDRGSHILKELPLVKDGLHYMFMELRPKTLHTISISARNRHGIGPNVTRNISTGSEKKPLPGADLSEARLIVATQERVIQMSVENYMYYLPQPNRYATPNRSVTIKGLDLHVKKKLYFVSDSSGRIRRLSFEDGNDGDTVISNSGNFNRPTLLTVDWLNNKLYFVEDSQISRCSFDGDDYQVVVSGVSQILTDIRVDPYIGYLYWIAQEFPGSAALYRVDLDKVRSTFVPREESEKVTRDMHLYSFTVDHERMRLLIPSSTKNTVVSYALDGSDYSDMRKNLSVDPEFVNVKSIALLRPGATFIWTNGTTAFGEEYNIDKETYNHNYIAYDTGDKHCVAVKIYQKSSQPDPYPLNPVEDVEAIFKEDMGKIYWSKPRLLGGLGRGAWQNWTYEVNLIDITENRYLTIHKDGINRTYHTMDNLLPNKTYIVRVRAYSVGGKGPWSTNFTGKTVRKSPVSSHGYPFIIWSAQNGLLKTDLLGEGETLLVSKDHFPDHVHITDMAWFRDWLFLNTNNGDVFKYNLESNANELIRLKEFSNVASIALDWLAPKLYRSSPIHQLISRSNLDGSHLEHLPIQTIAKELAIDAVQGRLYWATSHSIECSKLNGDEIHVYFQTGIFSGKHVMGLTLDFDSHKVYWMVRSHDGAVLYSANKDCDSCENLNESIEIIGSLPEDDVKGPLWYFSDHLYWLHEKKEAMISDMRARNVATLRGLGLSGLRSLMVVDPSLQPQPHHGVGEINVVPRQIKKHLIGLEGIWNNFSIHWQPVTNVNYGTVFYEITFHKTDNHKPLASLITTHSSYHSDVSKPLSPSSKLTLSIRPFTYWASARQTVVNLTTPEDVPSQPTNPRVFVTYHHHREMGTHDTEIEFRWSRPEKANGNIQGYQVHCHKEFSNHNQCNERWLEPETLHYKLYVRGHIISTYLFKVKAKTSMGDGAYSKTVDAETGNEDPVPKLLIAKLDSVTKTDSVSVMDIDNSQALFEKIIQQPVAVAFMSEAHIDTYFWLHEGGYLMSSQPNTHGSNATVVPRKLYGAGTSMAVDWIGRKLYWSERNEDINELRVMDLTLNREPRVLLNTTDFISAVEVDPFTSTIFYMVIRNGNGDLFACDYQGQNQRHFFRKPLIYHSITKRGSNSKCNCPLKRTVGHAMTLDRSDPKKPEVLWVDANTRHIWAADLSGCNCRVVVNATKYGDSKETGLPPTTITADKNKIYWSNDSVGKIFAVDKPNDSSRNKDRLLVIMDDNESRFNIQGIKAIGENLQPYPDPKCLSPKSKGGVGIVLERTPTSITLSLTEAERPPQCDHISQPTVLYTAYYGKISKNGERECEYPFHSCKTMTSDSTVMMLRFLEPFTNYTVQITTTNYYSNQNATPGRSHSYQTKEGVPSAPRNVTAVPVSPTRIDVFWEPPLVPNGNNISYEIRWHPTDDKHNDENAEYQMEPLFSEGRHVKSLTTKIEPATKYVILVRALSIDKTLVSDYANTSTTTFDMPENMTLEDMTPRYLRVKWLSPKYDTVIKHKLEYSESGTNIWNYSIPPEWTQPDRPYFFELTDLKPKATYQVQLQLMYNTTNVTYIWPPRDHPKFEFKTLGDLPDIPDAPKVKSLSKDLYQVYWDEVAKNGGEELVYELQLLHVPDPEVSQLLMHEYATDTTNVEIFNFVNDSSRAYSSPLLSTQPPKTPDWQTVYNGSQHQWIIADLPSKAQYEFRVRAITEYGASNFSEVGAEFFLPEPGAYMEPAGEQTEVILVAVLSASAFVVVSLVLSLYILQKRRGSGKKVIQVNGQIVHLPDVELATLRELPNNGNFIHQNNALYSVGDIPTDEELATIPHISREQIGLTKFLGSGAFGEVFEGTAHDLEDEGLPPIKVAVKTLRKGATEQEKGEFLKEAKLMSNFQHEHILKLLGICLNNNPNFIILELMEGGDLLSYLRSNRPVAINAGNLTLDDLLGICVDVAKGCKYLEEMHFVHRDLAARNCLVSSHNPALRIVKIGDFGLARDIYKNDYYRKEGEGLLPVRWMAPESLVDGVFTSQSDIWAFGVLLWEVMTLGQQPYPARTNLDVLHHVRGGGRLDKPGNCPEELHELMLKCWNYCAELRPSFTYCLQTLEDLKHKNSAHNTPLLPHSHNGRYYDEELAKIRDSVADQRPLLSERPMDNESIRSHPSLQEMSRGNDSRLKRGNSIIGSPDLSESFTSPLLQNGAMSSQQATSSTPKYLELLADNDFSTDTDGYEVPLPVLPPVALERLRKLESPPSEYAQMNQFLTKNLPSSNPANRRVKLPPTCLTTGPSNPPLVDHGVKEPARNHSTNDNYLIRSKKAENGRTALSPVVMSALLKSSPSNSLKNEEGDSTNGVETTNPFYRTNSTQSVGLTCTPSVHRCGSLDQSGQGNDSPFSGRKNSDSWSLSSASTSACLDESSKRNSGISTLSAISNGVDISYNPKSSWC